MTNQWLRLWHDMPFDPKWRVIARASGQPVALVIATFNFILVNASMSENRGHLERFRPEDVAAALDVDCDQIEAIMAAMQHRVLDGDYLTGWENRQVLRENDNSTDRVRAYRERQRALQEQGNAMKRTETQCNAPDTDTDSESSVPNGTAQSAPDFGYSPRYQSNGSGWRQKLFIDGLANLQQLTGRTESQCRGLIGKWLKQANDDARRVVRAIEDAVTEEPADPVPWITAALRGRRSTVDQDDYAFFWGRH